jgi:hypothetical protein
MAYGIFCAYGKATAPTDRYLIDSIVGAYVYLHLCTSVVSNADMACERCVVWIRVN